MPFHYNFECKPIVKNFDFQPTAKHHECTLYGAPIVDATCKNIKVPYRLR